MFNRKLITTFTLSALATGIIAAATPAIASVTYTYPATMCNSRDVVGNNGAAAELNSVGQAANISGSALGLDCPIISNGSAIQSASIDFWSNGSNTLNGSSYQAELCTTFTGGGGGQCNGSPYNGFNIYDNGSGVYSLPLTTLSYTPGGFNYISIGMSASTPESTNTLFGYTVVLAN
jgi:hypothetical protein